MSQTIDPETVAERVAASGALANFEGPVDAFYAQNLVGIMQLPYHIVVPLAYRPGMRIRFADGCAHFIEGGVTQMTLFLRATDPLVKDCEVEAKYFMITSEVRDSISIQACDRGRGFFVVGFLDRALAEA